MYLLYFDVINKTKLGTNFLIFTALFLIFGIFFAWETRKVRIEALNDSKEIGICVYNVMIMSVGTSNIIILVISHIRYNII